MRRGSSSSIRWQARQPGAQAEGIWMRPELSAHIECHALTGDGWLRAASFKGVVG